MNGKTILVTGGTGSFGQKFIRAEQDTALAPLPGPVPVQARLALWISAVGLAALGAARLWRA